MSCKGWGCFVSSPDADRMRRLESRDYSCKPELQARDFSREKLTDYASGKDFDRTEYNRMKAMVRDEDVIYVRSLDRLGRNKQLIKEELDFYRKKNVRVKILDIPTTMMELGEGQSDILAMITNILIEVLGTIAQRERETTLERQREGIAAAKRRGQRFGRPPYEFPDNWKSVQRHYLRGKVRAKEAMRLLNMKKSTFYKFVRMPVVT